MKCTTTTRWILMPSLLLFYCSARSASVTRFRWPELDPQVEWSHLLILLKVSWSCLGLHMLPDEPHTNENKQKRRTDRFSSQAQCCSGNIYQSTLITVCLPSNNVHWSVSARPGTVNCFACSYMRCKYMYLHARNIPCLLNENLKGIAVQLGKTTQLAEAGFVY